MPCLEAMRPRLSPFLTVYLTGLGLSFTTTGLGFGFGAETVGEGRRSTAAIWGGAGSRRSYVGLGRLDGLDGRCHFSGLSAHSST